MGEWQLNGHFILPAFSHHRRALGQSSKRWHFWGGWISDTCSERRCTRLVSKGITGMSFKGTMNLINTKPNTKVFIESPGILRSVNFRVFFLFFFFFFTSVSLSPASQAQVALLLLMLLVHFLCQKEAGVWFIISSAFIKWILRMLLHD